MKSILMLGLFSTVLFAQNSEPLSVPPQLRPWQEWVLDGQGEKLCPTPYNKPEIHISSWPSRLNLRVDRSSGSFTQEWKISNPSWVYLPSDASAWPQKVSANGKAMVVVEKGGQPALFLKEGTYRVQGSWQWKKAPQSLNIPRETALLDLVVDGVAIRYPRREVDGRLWLRLTDQTTGEEPERLVVAVFRHLLDEVPMIDHTYLEIEVSGHAREIILPGPMLEGFTPLSLNGSLPARLNEQGKLVIQVRPGKWTLTFVSRANGSPSNLTLPLKDAPWPQEELWSFSPRPSLRSVALAGLERVDPSRTQVPANWQEDPCYRATPGVSLAVEERGRGLGTTAPDTVSLSRSLWLDSSGKGFTFKDEISGLLNQQMRLSLLAPYALGRVLIDGEPQLITLLEGSDRAGVEVHQKQIQLKAEGRVEQRTLAVPASGWELTLDAQSTRLHIPPGWRLFAAIGPDSVNGDWVHDWWLWDFFWVLLFGAAVAKLYGKGCGIVALCALVLFHNESGAPLLMWFTVLALSVLQKATTGMSLHKLVSFGRWTAFVILVLLSLVFIRTQILQALYPQLYSSSGSTSAGTSYSRVMMPQDQSNPAAPQSEDVVSETSYEIGIPDGEPADDREQKASNLAAVNAYDFSLRGKVQTGPGIPDWEGTTAELSWQGPLDAAITTQLWFFPPWFNGLLALVRIALVAWLICLLAGYRLSLAKLRNLRGTAMLLPLLFLSIPSHAQEIPSGALLQELQKRLLRPADCYPNCAEIPEASLTAEGSELRIDFVVHASAAVAVPVPSMPFKVDLADAEEAMTLDGEGQLLVLVPAGIHVLSCWYQMAGKDQLPLLFPLKPRRLNLQLKGWEVQGVHDDDTYDQQIELRRAVRIVAEEQSFNTEESFRPFVEVVRTLTLENTWTLNTEVKRINEGAVVLEIPLLPGENVVSEVHVKNGKVAMSMSADESSFSWASVMDAVPDLTWSASTEGNWREVWRVLPNRLWHVSWSGSPAIEMFDDSERWQPGWQPRPGETLTLAIARPVPLEGQILTMNQVNLEVFPGKRTTKYILSLEVRSSIGGDHGISLPPGANVEWQTVDHKQVPVRFEAGKLILPLAPSDQRHEIRWTLPEGQGVMQRAAPVQLNQRAVNLTTRIELSDSRWLLWVWGPQMGPVLLFWGMFFTLLIAAYLLGRLKLTSLRFGQWLLLGLGVSQLHIMAAIVVLLWFFAIQYRGSLQEHQCRGFKFGLFQLALLALTFIFVIVLLLVLKNGLLADPNMYLTCPNGTDGMLSWYQDHSSGALPAVLVFSLPMWVYRMLMLLWSLWLARSVIAWSTQAWNAFIHQRVWPERQARASRAAPVLPVSEEPAPETGPATPVGEEPHEAAEGGTST